MRFCSDQTTKPIKAIYWGLYREFYLYSRALEKTIMIEQKRKTAWTSAFEGVGEVEVSGSEQFCTLKSKLFSNSVR